MTDGVTSVEVALAGCTLSPPSATPTPTPTATPTPTPTPISSSTLVIVDFYAMAGRSSTEPQPTVRQLPRDVSAAAGRA